MSVMLNTKGEEMEIENNETGYYHVITRGINKQIIFEEDKDYERYLNFMKKYSNQYSVNILAYCLMNNHVHLLVYDPNHMSSIMMKCINQCYVSGYNLKYEHIGSLIQNDLKKIPIQNEKYLINVFYYVLKNPLRACISKASSYKWNSYKEYFINSAIVNNNLAKTVYENEANLTYIIDEDDSSGIIYKHNPEKDALIKDYIKTNFEITNIKEINRLNKPLRDQAIGVLRKYGMTIKEASKTTGISAGIIQRIKC